MPVKATFKEWGHSFYLFSLQLFKAFFIKRIKSMEFLNNISLKDRNTFRIGGTASYYAEPKNQAEVLVAIGFAQQRMLPVFVLGKGSNVLISDHGWPGLIINLSCGFDKIKWSSDCVHAESGVSLNALVNQVIENEYCGMEELAGIPGTVGGAVIMNAGAFNTTISDTLHSVSYYDFLQNNIIECNAADLDLGYRTSRLQDKAAVILSAVFKFSRKCPKQSLLAIRKEILEKRKSKQPLEYPNCGSVFKRPPGGFAGTLIEKCGLKGLRIGDVEVSSKHANFIINKGNGTASDVRRLIKTIQTAVYEQFGIILEPEVIFVGDFDEPLLGTGQN